MTNLLKRALIIPPLIIGILAFMWLSNQQTPPADAPPETAQAVRVITLTPQSFAISTSGFGRVEAIRSWTAVSEVEGRLLALSDDIAIGKVVTAGDVLFEIDPRDYEIALAQADAALAAAQADLQELDVNAENLAATLALEQEVLAVSQTEFERNQTLQSRGSAAQSAVDSATRSLLAQRKVVRDLEAQIALLEPQRAALEAALGSAQSDVESARRNLDATTIRAPFTGRVVSQDVERDEYIRISDQLLRINDISASQIEGAFQPGALGNLFGSVSEASLAAALAQAGQVDAFEGISRFGLEALVRSATGADLFDWPARLVRSNGAIDDTTGAIGLVVEVDDPSRPDPATRRPPLTNGTFVEVILSGPEVTDALLIPREAVHQEGQNGPQYVYIVDAQNRLARAAIQTGSIVRDQVVLTQGPPAGTQIVLSDPQPPIIGLLLEPVEQTATNE